MKRVNARFGNKMTPFQKMGELLNPVSEKLSLHLGAPTNAYEAVVS